MNNPAASWEVSLWWNSSILSKQASRNSPEEIKNDIPHFGLKEHTEVDSRHGFVLATTLTPASVNDTNFLAYCTAFSRHTKQKIKKVYADKGYAGKPNRDFLALNKIEDGIMRKDSTTAKLTELEIQCRKAISKIRYVV
jgi:IS5 family transposase